MTKHTEARYAVRYKGDSHPFAWFIAEEDADTFCAAITAVEDTRFEVFSWPSAS